MKGWRVLLLLVVAACGGADARQARPGQAVVLVSLDGFRWDYLDRPQARNLRALAARGVRAERLVPVFPSKTFPNHYTLVTGLYPEHHGIIANTMWDDAIGQTFSLSARDVMVDPRWWGGEPLWVTAVKAGRASASFFWPGSDVAIGGVYPTYYRVYDGRVPNAQRIATVLDWLSLPGDSAPVFVTTYLSDVDGAGHEFGPDAPQTDSAIARVDTQVGALVAGLAARGLAGRVNLIVVSDHGMSATSPERRIYLDDYLDLSRVIVVDWSPVAAITPRPGYEDSAYARLRGAHPQLAVYHKAEVPARLHFNQHPRITPIVAIAADGWSVTARGRRQYGPGGNHGSDPELPSMGALFIAAGPAFRRGAVVEPFGAVHVYALMAHITGLPPASHDGSLDSVRALLR